MFEDGICQIEHGLYSRSFKFSDINYQTARRDEQVDLFTRYCEALNYCDPTIHLQINIVNRRIDKEAFKETMFMPMIDGQAKLNHYRKEMNGMLAAKALEGQNSILREKYITFSTAATSYETAIPALARLETDLMGHYKALGCEVAAMSGIDRLQQLHEIFRPGERFTFAYDQLLESSLTTKACIAPDSFDFTDKDMFSFGSHTGEHYGQVLFLRDLPAELSDKIISELSDLPIDMNITLHITNVEQGKALELVRRQIAFMEMEATGKQDQAVQKGRNADIAIPMETRRSYDEATKLLDLLENKNQRMFKVTLLVYTFADDIDTLQDNAFQIMATARKNNVKIDRLALRQREGIMSVAPIGKNLVNVSRTLTTASTAIFVPFTTMELYQKGGMYYGLNALSRNLIFFNRYSLKAPNGVILGTPGSGKSFAAKREMINVLLNDPNAEVLIIDPEREYTPLAQGFDGEIVHISAGSKNYINPMDCSMDYADDEEPLQLKAEFILTICELLVGGNPWLSFAGTYSVSGNTVTLQSAQDGTTSLTINQAQDGSYTLTGKYTYYQTEEAAKAALTAAAAQAAEDEANIIPNTVNKLLGEWTSLDGATTCTFTETGITVHTAATNVLPEETLYHEYEIISDKLIKIIKSGAAANYPYTLTESSDGVMTFYCTGIEYAPTYTKGTLSVQERAERYKAVYGIYPYNYNQSINNNTDNTITDRVISSERNPDVSEYARELDAYVKDMIVGTWKGTFDEWPTADSIYWSYTFSADGTYSFTNGTTTEAGTYTITSDPNNNYYHSSMQLTFDGGERTMQFYFTTTNPVKMITDDQTDPTYLKSLV